MSKQKAINPEKHYRVTLAGAVEIVPGRWARPGHEVVVTGAVLETIKDKVTAFEEV